MVLPKHRIHVLVLVYDGGIVHNTPSVPNSEERTGVAGGGREITPVSKTAKLVAFAEEKGKQSSLRCIVALLRDVLGEGLTGRMTSM